MMIVRKSVQDWLLEDANPPVRYMTMRYLMDLPSNNHRVRAAKNRIMDYAPINAILERRADFLPGSGKKYAPYKKYQGLYWQVIFLGDFLADGSDERVKACCEAVLDLQRDNGGFPYSDSHVILCLTGNVLRALSTIGYADLPQVIKGYEYLARRICDSGGAPCPVINYTIYQTCFMTVPRTLRSFNALPEHNRSEMVRKAMGILTRQLYDTEIYRYVNSNARVYSEALKVYSKKKKRLTSAERKSFRSIFLANNTGLVFQEKKSWKRFAFPLHYNSHILEVLTALIETGALYTEKCEEALEIVYEKKLPDDRWRLDNSLNGKMLVDIEEKGKPSKWITFYALYVMKHIAGLWFTDEGRKHDEIFD